LLPSLLHHKKKQMLLLASLSKSTENALKAWSFIDPQSTLQ
jgi:hypothetical protein